MRENSCCTLRVLEVILNLVELLMDMGVLKQFLRNEALNDQRSTPLPDASPGKPTKSSTGGTTLPPAAEVEKLSKPMSPHKLVMHIIVRQVIYSEILNLRKLDIF